MQPDHTFNIVKIIPWVLFFCAFASANIYGDEPHLDWNNTRAKISPDPHDTEAEGQFSFTNRSKSPITITNIRATCGCTAVQAHSGEKETYKPGEQGHIDFTITFSRGSGELTKYIYVTTSNGQSKTTTKLSIMVDATPYIEVTPEMLFWSQGEKDPAPQVAQFKVLAETPIHITDMRTSGDSEAFSVDKKTIEKGHTYDIEIQPHNTDDRHKITCTLRTDFPSQDNPLTYKVSASITPSIGGSMPDKKPEKSFFYKFVPTDHNTYTFAVLGLSILGGTAIALLVLAVVSKSASRTDGPRENE